MDTVYSGGRAVAILPGGGFSVTRPDPHKPTRDEVLRGMQAEMDAAFDGVREALPHRHERRPGNMDQQDRELQERSLGRPRGAGERQGDIGGKTEVIYLHPMRDEQYLFTLAGMLPELEPRLSAMRAEMLARPEEFGTVEQGGRVFDLKLFRDCGEPWPPGEEVRRGNAAAEVTLAAFISWVACPRSMEGIAAAGLVLSGITWWGARSRWVFGTWSRWPWFCYGEG